MNRYFFLIALLFSVQSFAAMTPTEFTNYLINKKNQNQTMSASEQAAFEVYENYKNDSAFSNVPNSLQNYTASVYNFFKMRVGSAATLPPDRQASLHIFLNRNPQRIIRFGNTTEHIKKEADLVAKAYNTNECQRAGGTDCELLTDQEISSLERIDRALSIKRFFTDAQNRIASDFSALGSGIANTVRAITTPTPRTSHIINCEVSPPQYNRCVTIDGIVYVRQTSQPISDIEAHIRKASEQRETEERTGSDAPN